MRAAPTNTKEASGSENIVSFHWVKTSKEKRYIYICLYIYISGWLKQTIWDLVLYQHFHSSLDLTGVRSHMVKPPHVSVTTVWLQFSLSGRGLESTRVHLVQIYPESVKARELRMGVAVEWVRMWVRSVFLSVYEWWTSRVWMESSIWRVHNWCFGEFHAALKIIFSTTQATGHCSLSTIHNRQYTHLGR